MNKKALEKKRIIKNIKSAAEYTQYRDSLNLTDEQKILFDSVFLHGYDYSYIADCVLGCSVNAIKYKMKKLLNKL